MITHQTWKKKSTLESVANISLRPFQELRSHLDSRAANPWDAQSPAFLLHAALHARQEFPVAPLLPTNQLSQLLKSSLVQQYQQFLCLTHTLLHPSMLRLHFLIRLPHLCPQRPPVLCNAYSTRHSSALPTAPWNAVDQLYLHTSERKAKYRDRPRLSRLAN